MFQLVAVDLDGTLLSSKHEIAEENRQALAACIERGVRVAIVTGRRFPAARPYVDELPIDPIVVANSGAIIKAGVNGPLLRRRLLGRDIAEAVIEIASDASIEPVVHDGPNAEGHLILRRVARGLPHVGRYLHQTMPPPIWVPSIRLERDPVQIGFVASVSAIRELAARLSAELDDISLARTEYPLEELALLDVLAVDANKSAALKFLSNHYHVSLSETLAIGDNWNDLDMLETAGLGVVVANAVDELKSRGFAQTTSNDEAGVANAIHRYVLED